MKTSRKGFPGRRPIVSGQAMRSFFPIGTVEGGLALLVLACAVLLAVAILITAALTASILLGLLAGSLAALTLQGTRELSFRARRRWRAKLPPSLLRTVLALSLALRIEPSPRR